MMIRILIFVLVALTSSACDPVYRAEIKNETERSIIILIGFDKDELERNWREKSYIPFLKSYPNIGNIDPVIKFDTLKLISTYEIPSGKSFPLETGIGGHPDYLLFRSLLVLKPDSLFFENRHAIENAFVKTGERTWELKIK